jgi:hypothetical protein
MAGGKRSNLFGATICYAVRWTASSTLTGWVELHPYIRVLLFFFYS